MSTEVFVDGICEIDDSTIQAYFTRFGSRITNYESHRHRPTNACCFALISFVSHHTVNAILHKRPHSIDSHSLFVKRSLPADVCSFIERLLPVSSLFVYNQISKDFDEKSLKTYFETFGHILKFQRDYNHGRLLIEYDDYDSVDKIFLNKDQLPEYIDIHKNILPRAQTTIEYHGTCRRQQEENPIDEKKKKQRSKKTNHHADEQYQDLLQKTIEDLRGCKAQLRSMENDYTLLQMEYSTLKDENNQLNQLLDQPNTTIKGCLSCQNHELTIHQLQQTLLKLNEQYDTTKSQYLQLLSTQYTTTMLPKAESEMPMITIKQPYQYLLSTRLRHNEYCKDEVLETCASQSNLPTPEFYDLVSKQPNSSPSTVRAYIPQYRITYKYNSVLDDEE